MTAYIKFCADCKRNSLHQWSDWWGQSVCGQCFRSLLDAEQK